MVTDVGGTLTELAAAHIEAFNQADWKRMRDGVVTDVVYEETGTSQRLEGVDIYIAIAQAWHEACFGVRGFIRNCVESGNSVVVELRWSSKYADEDQTGERSGIGSQPVTVGTLWYDFEGDKIREARNYVDVLSLRQQLGLLS